MIFIYKVIFLIFIFIPYNNTSVYASSQNDLEYLPKKLVGYTKVLNKADQNFTNFPTDLIKEVSVFLAPNDILNLRQTCKALKQATDSYYWQDKKVHIKGEFSSPLIQDIKNILLHNVVLSINKWEQKDIRRLFYFKSINYLYLEGINDWNFSTAELFNSSPCSLFTSYCASISNYIFSSIFGMELMQQPSLFLTVASLEIPDSKIGDYGVICFISKFQNLRHLNISNNDIGQNVIGEVDAIAVMENLTSLDISKNYFTSKSVALINKLKNLTYLNISNNKIYDEVIIRRLSRLPKVKEFIYKEEKS